MDNVGWHTPEKVSQLSFHSLPTDASRKLVKDFYKNLANQKGQFYGVNPNGYDYESGVLIHNQAMPYSIFTISGTWDGNHPTQFSIFLGRNNNVIGYGGVTAEDPTTAQLAFKVFADQRAGLDSRELFDDFLKQSVAAMNFYPQVLHVPTNQLYAPSIEPEVTPAALFYRKKGFSSPQDSELPQSVQNKLHAGPLKAGRMTEDDLKTLSQNDLYLNIKESAYQTDIEEIRIKRVLAVSQANPEIVDYISNISQESQNS